MKLEWLKDPNNDYKPSVTLTLLMVTFLVLLTLGVLQSLEKVKNVGPFLEMLYSFCALYLGRRLNFKGNSFTAEKAEEIKEKVENKLE